MATSLNAPPHPSIDISRYPKLDFKQAGHLRHFYNLVNQPDGQWNYMDTKERYQEFDDCLRYQLATMTYAAGAAHYHRLPVLRGPFKSLMHQMITKMLHRDVWNYWFTSSLGSKLFDPSMTELRRPWADPVIKENIMYSGHVLLMTSLYAMLFDEAEYEKEGGLTWVWDPLFVGLGHEKFSYSNRELENVIFKQMEENGWVGVCCEPNAVFVVCNQFPIIAMRYNDSRNGTDRVSTMLRKYEAALEKNGMLQEDGLTASFFALKQGKAVGASHGAHTAWASAFMNSWDSDRVYANYEKQTMGFLTDFGGKTELNPARVAMAFRKLVAQEGWDPRDSATLKKARDPSTHVVNRRIPFETLNWGTFTMMLSELGKQKELSDLHQYLDERLNPTWERGGLFYPRNDELADESWRLTHVEPHSGNSGIAYSRLNVKDGQKTMWAKPWTRQILCERPWVDGIGFEDDVDFLRGDWDAEKQAVVLTMKRWQGVKRSQNLIVRNLPAGKWAVYVGDALHLADELRQRGDIVVPMEIGQEEVDVIVEKIQD